MNGFKIFPRYSLKDAGFLERENFLDLSIDMGFYK
jgi:hypothetical protein